jgi:hypothetical protein
MIGLEVVPDTNPTLVLAITPVSGPGEDTTSLGTSSSRDEGTERAAGVFAVADKERGARGGRGAGVGVLFVVADDVAGRAGEEDVECDGDGEGENQYRFGAGIVCAGEGGTGLGLGLGLRFDAGSGFWIGVVDGGGCSCWGSSSSFGGDWDSDVGG